MAGGGRGVIPLPLGGIMPSYSITAFNGHKMQYTGWKNDREAVKYIEDAAESYRKYREGPPATHVARIILQDGRTLWYDTASKQVKSTPAAGVLSAEEPLWNSGG
jgi:hypothetical protein